ncbi:MAG: hypothetical protein H7Y36_10025 [Armatimonadetes bacterium]|nr:hypothetical protein [Akkermansiaceae bacterium]
MSRHSTHAISLCLIGAGMFAWAFAGRPLATNPNLSVPLNPMGINGSPYGEVFAMAMQGPIDTYFHGSMGTGVHRHVNGKACASCNGKAPVANTDFSTPKIFRIPQPEALPATKAELAKVKPTLGQKFETFLGSLEKLETISTNPKATSDAHKLYLRRQTEEKLRFAYQLDPAHYGNYNSLNFFLSEPAIGTRRELNQPVAKLAEETIEYCLKQEHDPRPALTAAAAATNILQFMFADQQEERPKFNTTQMRQFLGVLDYSLARYDSLAKEWDETKHWDLISTQRINECEDRYSFIRKIREACEKTILRLEGKHQPQASN